MCGISIILRSGNSSFSEETLREMVRISRHRGPDGDGVLFHGPEGTTSDAAAPPGWNAGFGHRRLAIIDLSSAGLQPMRYEKSLWLTFNGEIYNYLELRDELKALGQEFTTQTDSEVILAAYAAWGTDGFRRLRGMWAFAILDTERQRVVFSRDRLGIKPLYMVATADGVAAASEIKQFKALPRFSFRANDGAVRQYLETGHEDPAATLLEDVVPLRPGSWVSFDLNTCKTNGSGTFWHPQEIGYVHTDAREAADVLHDSLRESIRLHLRSDVPVGLSLSGGLDSSSIAGVVSRELGRVDVQTFTCSFPGEGRDETRFAAEARAGLKGAANYFTPTAAEFRDELKAFTWSHDEPVGSLSVYAAYRMAKTMRAARVPVTLSGQGGDEALGGYRESYWNYLRKSVLEGAPQTALRHLGGALLPGGNRDLWTEAPGLALRLWNRSRGGVDFLRPPAGESSARGMLSSSLKVSSTEWRVHEMQQLFLPRLLKWEDRNSMAFSVEGRYPFLDHVFLETALSMHPRTGYSRGWTKNTLRIAMKGVVPESIRMRRDKNGFEVPASRWLADELRPMLEGWLGEERPLWDHVNRKSVRALAESFWSQDGPARPAKAQMLFRLFACDQWLEVFDVTWR